ncbi:TPA: hypothetical protein ACHWKL_004281 [Providencia stuartii]|uniref:hypothetical protein n=1 Tax=Providencia stuartii TaxID=588 RepID=UPI00113FC63E|nr:MULTISPECIES: hypothetical protein [Providencia]MBN5562997.1 hypothetical protein [Providencia stuartii]MBN5602950.1 hypothetical protein [Providencia stuartii]MBN5606976.1 hypothetical protein [Providencia stuartii]MCL8327483.1 hypothetical protein [Providencia thailandensis]MDF4176414.1 hypothetical protein [Providencia thailandensis]
MEGECWATARKNYWKAEVAPKGLYSKIHMAIMKLGLAPKIRIKEYHYKSRSFRIRDVSLELNHRIWPQRSGKNIDMPYNLEKVTPWEHAAVDPYRHTGSDLIEIIQGIDKYKGF